ncbi:MAG: hypothetical protein JZU50_14930, partial [Desulfobulbaceae bacterium]|nr:hypothetical protein [Desulfobulbaceae bacterium]
GGGILRKDGIAQAQLKDWRSWMRAARAGGAGMIADAGRCRPASAINQKTGGGCNRTVLTDTAA